MIGNASRAGLDALERETASWRERLLRWRCSLAAPEPHCRQLQITLVRLSLSDVEASEDRSRILRLHNKLTLKAEDVDFLSDLGRRLLAANPDYRRAIRSLLP